MVRPGRRLRPNARLPSARPRAWQVELGRRLRRMFVLKLLGTTAFTWLFFVAYFHLLRSPAYAVTRMPLTPLDRWIPFQPATLVAYLSLWVYVGIAPGLQTTLRALLGYGLWAAALCGSGLAAFYLWPTAVPALPHPASTFPGYALLQGVDAAGNACPSMHVAIAVFTGVWIDRALHATGSPVALRLVNALWLLGIVWSTLAVKQHVVLDVLAGALLGVGFSVLSLRVRSAVNTRSGRAIEWI